MIPFNIPPHVGTEEKYIAEAIASGKICGDGQFTKKCNAWIEERFGAKTALLTTSGSTALNMDRRIAGVKANVMVKPIQSRAGIDRAAKRILADFYGRIL